MGTIPNSSLPFNDNAVNGDNVDYNAWNQAMQVIQLAVNDNQSQINAIKSAQTTILVAHGTIYPTNPAPSSGQLFYRDDLSQLKMFNGTQWEDVESVVATANGLSINGVAYNISTSAIANTIALRDATGSITAQTFHGNADTATSATTATNANNLNNQPASYYLPASGTATNSNELNGQPSSYYAPASTVPPKGYEFEVINITSGVSATNDSTYVSSIVGAVSTNVSYFLEVVGTVQSGYWCTVYLKDVTLGTTPYNIALTTSNSIQRVSVQLTAGHTYGVYVQNNNPVYISARIVGQV